MKKPKVNYDEIIKTVLNKEKTNYVSSDVESNKQTKAVNTEICDTEESSKVSLNIRKTKTGRKSLHETLEKILQNAENASSKKANKKEISVKNRIGCEKNNLKTGSCNQDDKKSKIYSYSNNKINNLNVNVKNIDLTDCVKECSSNIKSSIKVIVNGKSKQVTKSPHCNQNKFNFDKTSNNFINSTKIINQNTNIEKSSKEKENFASTLSFTNIEKKIDKKFLSKNEKINKKSNEIIKKFTQKELISSQTISKMKIDKENNPLPPHKEKSYTPIPDKPANTNTNNLQIYLNSAVKCSKTVELDLNRCSSEKVIFKKITNFNIIPTVRTNLYDTQTTESNNNNNNSSENSTIFSKFKRSIVSLSEARKNKSLTKQNTNSLSEESLNNIKKIKDNNENSILKKEFNLTTITTTSNKIDNIVNPFKKDSSNDNKVYSYDDSSFKEFKRFSLSLDHKIVKTEENTENGNTNRIRKLDQYRTKMKLIHYNKDEFTYNTNNTEIS